MRLKRMLAAFLAAAVLCSLLAAVPASAAPASGFTDITDGAVAQAAETLRLLGIVNGTGGGAFHPSGSLTRAEFCKMAVEALGKGDEAAAQANRTVFTDVKGDHWARGYINLAASYPVGGGEDGKGATMLMMGVGDSTFRPGDVINYAQAVTVMMRILGYGDKDVAAGAAWYEGYLATAKAIGLTDGVDLAWDSAITRGQTALLFENLLYCKPNKGDAPFLTTLGGKILDEAIILSLDATAADGTTGAVQATAGEGAAVYKTDHAPFDAALDGRRAKLVLDKDSKVIAIQPSDAGTFRTVTVVSAEATYLTAAGGEKLNIPPAAAAYKDGVKKTYKDIYVDLKPGAQVSLQYAPGGKVEYVFLPTAQVAEKAAVADSGGVGAFSALVGKDTGYRIVKNGVTAAPGDIRQYDAATYDRATKTLYVSDLRLTGVYQNASPSPSTPLEVTVLGATFPVLSSAFDDLTGFKIGDAITLLLTSDGQVAGAVSPSVARSTTVGVAEVDTSSRTPTATVTPLADIRDTSGKKITLSGKLVMSSGSAAKFQGQLVTVSSSKVGELTLTGLGNSGAAGELNVAGRTMDGAALADNVRIYDRVGNGKPQEVSFSQLTMAAVPASKVSYVGKDYAGRVNILVLDDATGDLYAYGIATPETVSSSDTHGNSVTNPGVQVEYGNGKTAGPMVTTAEIKKGSLLGIAASLTTPGGVTRLANYVTLKELTGVPRSAFDITVTDRAEGDLAPIGTVTVGGVTYPVAGNVVCYNKTTKSWFASLTEARAYADTLTLYYDRAPGQGGKIRLVVAE